jgi:hypothetical protein
MSSKSSKSSKSVGNTRRQISPSKHWFFTFNNYSSDDISKILSLVPEFQKYAFQEEKGKNNTKHIQGYIEFKSKIRPRAMFHWTDKIHWEKPRSISHARNYCLKQETRCGRQWTNLSRAELKYNGPEINLRDWQRYIIDILEQITI